MFSAFFLLYVLLISPIHYHVILLHSIINLFILLSFYYIVSNTASVDGCQLLDSICSAQVTPSNKEK